MIRFKYALIGKRKPTVVVGCMEFIMSKNIAVIPKGTKIQIMGCSYILQEDALVDGDQAILEATLKAQENFDNGVGVVGGHGLKNATN